MIDMPSEPSGMKSSLLDSRPFETFVAISVTFEIP